MLLTLIFCTLRFSSRPESLAPVVVSRQGFPSIVQVMDRVALSSFSELFVCVVGKLPLHLHQPDTGHAKVMQCNTNGLVHFLAVCATGPWRCHLQGPE